jgi:membrane-associated protein
VPLETTLAAVSALGPDWLDPETLLNNFLDRFGTLAFVAVLVVVFVECGLFMFFLPGDSLLFITGLFVATGQLGVSLWLAALLLTIAAIAGNVVGYWIGAAIGPRLFTNPNARFLKAQYVEQTHEFFVKHGPKAIVLARFVPIVRTFITLMAGVGRMDFRTYFVYSALGGILWAAGLTTLGYFLGGVPFVQNNLEIIVIGIVVLSILPAVFEWLRARRERGAAPEEPAEQG